MAQQIPQLAEQLERKQRPHFELPPASIVRLETELATERML